MCVTPERNSVAGPTLYLVPLMKICFELWWYYSDDFWHFCYLVHNLLYCTLNSVDSISNVNYVNILGIGDILLFNGCQP